MTVRHANIDTNTENDEAHNCQNLDNRKNELGFTISSDSEEIDSDNENEKERDPYTRIDRSCPFPVGQSDGSGDNFERKCNKPVQGVARKLTRDPEQ